MLLADVLGCERLKLYMDPEREPEPTQLERLRVLVARALRHEPIQYLTGEAWFFGLPFTVDRRVLIPRPSTETIVESVIQTVRARERGTVPVSPAASEAKAESNGASEPPSGRRARAAASAGAGLLIADVCTGSGCVAVALAKNLGSARFIATDLSPDALAAAADNARRHGVHERVEFRAGDLLVPLAGEPLDFLLANPPYIPDHEWGGVAPNVRDHEPHGALRAGPTGLELVAPILAGAAGVLKPGGAVLVEVAACTAAQAADLAREAGLSQVEILKDSDGLERVVRAERAGAA